MTASKKLLFPAAAAIAAIGAGGWYALGWAGRGDDSIHVSGNIEAVEVAVSFKIAGRVDKRYVDEGDPVKAGQPVAQLETADLEADVDLRRAELDAAAAALAELKNGSRPDEIASAEAAMEKAQANYDALKNGSRPEEIAAADAEFQAADADREHLRLDLKRDEQAHQADAGTISAEQLDLARAASRMADQRYLAGDEALRTRQGRPPPGRRRARQGRHATGRGPIPPGQGRAAKRGHRPGRRQGRPGQGRLEIRRDQARLCRRGLAADGRRPLEEHRTGRVRGRRHAGRHRGRYRERLAAGLR